MPTALDVPVAPTTLEGHNKDYSLPPTLVFS